MNLSFDVWNDAHAAPNNTYDLFGCDFWYMHSLFAHAHTKHTRFTVCIAQHLVSCSFISIICVIISLTNPPIYRHKGVFYMFIYKLIMIFHSVNFYYFFSSIFHFIFAIHHYFIIYLIPLVTFAQPEKNIRSEWKQFWFRTQKCA